MKKMFKPIVSLLCFTMVVSPVAAHAANGVNAETTPTNSDEVYEVFDYLGEGFSIEDENDLNELIELAQEADEEEFEELTEEELLEEIEEIEEVYIDIMDFVLEIPDYIAEYGDINDGVEWLNENKGPEFDGQIFVADGEFLGLEADPNYMGIQSIAGCAWGIGKAIAMNALPWAKILKIKKAVQIMGGTRVVANVLINAYKHQRNLGYGRTKAIKRAIDVSKRAVPGEYVKHWVEFFSLGVIKKECF